MLRNFFHVIGYNYLEDPYTRLLRTNSAESRYIPEYDLLGIKEAPPFVIDIYHLVETCARLNFVESNTIELPLPGFTFWSAATAPYVLRNLADYARDSHYDNLVTELGLRAVRRDYSFGSYEMASDDAFLSTDYFNAALAGEDVPRISSRDKISDGVRYGDDLRMIYKDFNEMRRFLIRLDSVRGYEAARHAIGTYLDKDASLNPRQIMGPYVESLPAGTVVSLVGTVYWNGGSETSREFPAAFEAKIAGDTQRLKNRNSRPFTIIGEVMRFGSARLIYVWIATIWKTGMPAPVKYIAASVEIPLTKANTSESSPVWSFNFDLSKVFDEKILPRIKSLYPQFDSSVRRVTINQSYLIFDTGDTAFRHLCPDGWDYVPKN